MSGATHGSQVGRRGQSAPLASQPAECQRVDGNTITTLSSPSPQSVRSFASHSVLPLVLAAAVVVVLSGASVVSLVRQSDTNDDDGVALTLPAASGMQNRRARRAATQADYLLGSFALFNEHSRLYRVPFGCQIKLQALGALRKKEKSELRITGGRPVSVEVEALANGTLAAERTTRELEQVSAGSHLAPGCQHPGASLPPPRH